MRSKLKLATVWASSGTPNIQASSIVRHNESVDHRSASSECEKEIGEQIIVAETDSDHEEVPVSVTNKDKIVFNTVCFAAKSEIPSETVNGILALQTKNGLSVQYTNLSWDLITGMQKSIATVLKNQ